MELVIEGLTIKLGKKNNISHLDFRGSAGEVIGLVAPNGTGKTTLFRALAALLPIAKGSVSIGGIPLLTQRKNYMSQLFFVEGVENLYINLTPRQHLLYVAHAWKSQKRAQDIAQLLGMQAYLDTPVKKLSLGMKQHLLIGMYLISESPVLLLDEPLNGLDPSSVELVNRCLKQLSAERRLVILSSHDLFNLEKVCSRVLFLKNKRLEHQVTQMQSLEEEYKRLFHGEEVGANAEI